MSGVIFETGSANCEAYYGCMNRNEENHNNQLQQVFNGMNSSRRRTINSTPHFYTHIPCLVLWSLNQRSESGKLMCVFPIFSLKLYGGEGFSISSLGDEHHKPDLNWASSLLSMWFGSHSIRRIKPCLNQTCVLLPHTESLRPQARIFIHSFIHLSIIGTHHCLFRRNLPPYLNHYQLIIQFYFYCPHP